MFYNNFEEAAYSGRAGSAVRLYQTKIVGKIPSVSGGVYLELGSHSLELTEMAISQSARDSSVLAAVDLAFPKPAGRARASRLESMYTGSKLTMLQADVSELPFVSQSVDVVFHGCLLHHLEKPLESLNEIRRVTRESSTIVYYLPCDPGLLLRLIQRLLSQRVASRVMKRYLLSVKFLWAIEHRNHFASLREMIHHVHLRDSVKSFRYPFRWRSWNLNLFELIVVTRKAC